LDLHSECKIRMPSCKLSACTTACYPFAGIGMVTDMPIHGTDGSQRCSHILACTHSKRHCRYKSVFVVLQTDSTKPQSQLQSEQSEQAAQVEPGPAAEAQQPWHNWPLTTAMCARCTTAAAHCAAWHASHNRKS
jgi:hypothetical protein